MIATLRRGRARIVAIVTGAVVAASAAVLAAEAAAAQPPLPGDSGVQMQCLVEGPAGPHVVIQRRPDAPAAPLPQDLALRDYPAVDLSGPVIVAPGRPGDVHIQPGRSAGRGSSGI